MAGYHHLTQPVALSVEQISPKMRLAAKWLAEAAAFRKTPNHNQHEGELYEIWTAVKLMERDPSSFTLGNQITRKKLPGELNIQQVQIRGTEIDSLPFLNGERMIGQVRKRHRSDGGVIKNALGFYVWDRFFNDSTDELKGFYYVTPHDEPHVRTTVLQNILPILLGKEETPGFTGGVRMDLAPQTKEIVAEIKKHCRADEQFGQLAKDYHYYEDVISDNAGFKCTVLQIPKAGEGEVKRAVKQELPAVEAAVKKELPDLKQGSGTGPGSSHKP